MTDTSVDAVQLAVQATFPLFAQNKDMALLARQMAEFKVVHGGAFSQVESPFYAKLLDQVENLFGFLRHDCQDLTDLDGYFAIMSAFMREIPISPNIFDEVVGELFSSKVDFLSEDDRRSVFQCLADNLTTFNTLENFSRVAMTSVRNRTPDQLLFEMSVQERHTQELLHWIAASDDPLVFEVLGEQVLSHIFSGSTMGPAYDPASMALWICIDHEQRRVASNERNNRSDPQSPMVGWFERNQSAVVATILQGTWSTKYHPKHISKLTTHLPALTEIAKAMTLRSFDQKGDFLLAFRKTYGEAPDAECIAIQAGRYNEPPDTPTANSLESLMAYSLVYEDILGDEWNAPDTRSLADILIYAIEAVEKHGLAVNQSVLEKLATRSLDALRRDDDVSAILRNNQLKPLLNGNKRFQGIRLEQDLGM